MHRPILSFASQGWIPTLFNEHVAALSDVGSPIPAFSFTEPNGDMEQPPRGVLTEFVQVLISRLELSIGEVVLAYSLVEDALRNVQSRGLKPHADITQPRAEHVRPSVAGTVVGTLLLDPAVVSGGLHSRVQGGARW